MALIEAGGNKITIDDEGFLVNIGDWSEEVAKILASREGMTNVTEEQMEVISFLRKYYQKFHSFPILNYVCKNIHQPRECMNEQFINPELAWKLAGLPKLSGIHFVAVDGKHYHMEECC